jgi:DNA-binding HxlR family transcriptional regulator
VRYYGCGHSITSTHLLVTIVLSRTQRSRPISAGAAPLGDPWNSSCPSRELIDTLASKWVLLLIPLLRTGSRRNNDLMRTLQGISQKMLTQTLRSLEERRIVTRHDFKEIPPRVEYGLTPLGRSLARALTGLDKWVAENYHLTTSSRETQSQRRK